MALTNKQYQSLLNEYDKRRSEAEYYMNLHLDEIRTKIPEFAQLEDKRSLVAADFARRRIDNPSLSLADLDRELAEISEQKDNLLRNNGYTPEYIMPRYQCTDCEDTGFINRQKCHCFKQAEIEILYRQSNIREFLQTENFSKLSTDLHTNEDLVRFNQAVEICHSFINNFDNTYRNILFCGTVGTGKSFLSCCISHELLNLGHSVIYFSSSELFATISSNTFHNNAVSESIPNEDLYNCDLLVIDDLGTEIGGQFVNSSLFTCLNERFLRHKPIIISTNLSLSEIHDRYSDRVFSRIAGSFDMVKLTGPDLRIQ